MRRDTSEPCWNHRPGGRRHHTGRRLDDVRAVSADRVAVTIGTAGNVPRLPGCQESAGILIGRPEASWACQNWHRHPEPAKCRRFPVLVARGRGTANRKQLFPFCRPPVHRRSVVYGRHRDEAAGQGGKCHQLVDVLPAVPGTLDGIRYVPFDICRLEHRLTPCRPGRRPTPP